MTDEIDDTLSDLRDCRLELAPRPVDTSEPTFWLGLLDGVGVEASYQGYARIQVSASTPQDADLSFPTATAPFQVQSVALFSAPTGSEIKYVFNMNPLHLGPGDTLSTRPSNVRILFEDSSFSLVDLLQDREALSFLTQLRSFRDRPR